LWSDISLDDDESKEKKRNFGNNGRGGIEVLVKKESLDLGVEAHA
jgi:hypothetical protein